VFPGRRYRENWAVRIEGVEVFPKYIMPHQEFLYDEIHIGKIEELVDTIGDFDMYIFGDVLEHLPEETAVRVLESAYRKANKAVLINIPLGRGWLREGSDENEYEAHLSAWELEDFVRYCPKVCGEAVFEDIGTYATLLIDKTLSESDKADLMHRTGKLYVEHNPEFAARCFKRSVELGCGNAEPYLELSKLLFEHQNPQDAVQILHEAVDRFPDDAATYDLLGRLLRKLNRADEAVEILAAKPQATETS
jgi:tetratricopeptide (TPR) repeat protein